jgi:AcrR family transcriptional regulator
MTGAARTSETSPRRVDAERNRGRTLSAARAAFADPEADVSMAEISRRAGVGSPNLHPNFANRRQLLEALYVDESDAVCEAAATIGGDTPGGRLTAWLRCFWAYFTSRRLVAAELLKHSDADEPDGRRHRQDPGGHQLPRGDPGGRARFALCERADWLSTRTYSRVAAQARCSTRGTPSTSRHRCS